jgi:RES domain-containing protein
MQLFRFGLESYIDDLSGYGAKLYGGRWNNVGSAMLYSACSPSLAMLEFVCNASGIAKTLQTCLLTLKLDSKVKFEVLTTNDLPENWQDVPAPDVLKRIGDNWIKSNASLVLKVPSAVMPIEFNVLINPLHKDFPKLSIENIVKMDIDNRILKTK